jgi:hypothetical protein
MVPTPTLTEYLVGFDKDARRRQLAVLQRSFVIPAFDVPSAYLAAGLSREARTIETPEHTRQQVRTAAVEMSMPAGDLTRLPVARITDGQPP